MIVATQIRRGMLIQVNNTLYQVFDMIHTKTVGRGSGMVSTKLRDVLTGNMIEHRFRPDEKVKRTRLDERAMEFLYEEGAQFYFMDLESYEQLVVDKDRLGSATDFLIPNQEVSVTFYQGKPIGVELPRTVELKVVDTQPQLKGATVSNVNKPATLETGLIIQVPPFIEVGETIKVDTETNQYAGRA